MQRSAWIAFAMLCLLVPYAVRAQEQPERLSAAQNGSGDPEARGHAEGEDAVLVAANAEIRQRLNARGEPLGDRAAVDAIGRSNHASGGYALVFRYRLEWVEWSHAQLLTASDEQQAAAVAAAAAATLDLAPLDVNILSREDANRILESCSPLLSAVVRPLRPPFHHRLTNVYWDPRAKAPFLQSSARVPGTENDCVRADLNLVTGQSLCRDMACAVR